MSVTLSIKGVLDEWAERLRMRAERNHRSRQGNRRGGAAASGRVRMSGHDPVPGSVRRNT